MANTEVGSAYVTIYPQTDGNFSKQVGAQMDKGSSGLSAKAVAMGNMLSGAIMGAVQSAAAAVGDMFVQTFQSYADYEQLVGGVDTLFKESSAIVQQNAANAFKTAGLSANEYMETVTSFSASLLQSLGGDTAAAAAYADTALRDMSDNANKMGSDMASIQNAYQGFAKQNYTMLDNLKLGYGGTKSEMERLLADASRIAGVEFNIDSYSDVIQAIHVMQESMGIAGTTALEAEGTISGSLNTMRSSWDNLLAGILNENADMGALFEQFLGSVGSVAANLAPRFGVLFTRIFTELPNSIATAMQELPSKIEPMLQSIFGEELGSKMSESLGEGIQGLMGAFDSIFQVVQTVWPTIQEVIQGAMTAIGEVVSVTWPLIGSVVQVVGDMILFHVQYVWPVVQGVISAAISAIITIINGLQPIVSFVTGVFNGIHQAIVNPVETARGLISTAIDGIKQLFSFQITWPNIPLPHFSVSGSVNPLDWLSQGPPSISVEWYAKGGFVDGATLIGAGEAGPEMILPRSGGLMDEFASAISDRIGAGGTTYNIVIDNARINDDAAMRSATRDYLIDLHRIGAI